MVDRRRERGRREEEMEGSRMREERTKGRREREGKRKKERRREERNHSSGGWGVCKIKMPANLFPGLANSSLSGLQIGAFTLYFSPCLPLKCACGDLCLSHSSFSYKCSNPIIGATSF